jgi:uncharacterized membrane protein
MHKIEVLVVVDRPVSMVYNQWTQFEEFPEFMSGIAEAHQVDDTHVHWKAKLGGKQREWDAEITEQEPDRRISWKSVSGAHNAGTVRFKPVGQDRTEVHLLLVYDTDGPVESMGHALGRIGKRVQQSLLEFKDFAERHAVETGAWRGEVVAGEAHRRPIVHSPVGWPLLSP